MVFFPLSILATASLIIWLYLLFHPARPWDFYPVGDAEPLPAPLADAVFPPLTVIVPARNEAVSLPRTLPALLSQDYPRAYRVVVVDDRSDDGTADLARQIAAGLGHPERLTVMTGKPLPDGWTGKVWALDQGIKATLNAGSSGYVLLTDADILHAPVSFRRLVMESQEGNLALNSRMARLRCSSSAERLLIPAFVYFFNLLYPMRKVNNVSDKTAAAAGGCALLSADALARMGGGLEAIRGDIIDDVNLARQVKKQGVPIRLSLSRSEVESLREYPNVGDIWRMVRRTAFTELKYSWLRLAGSLFGLVLLFVVPAISVLAGVTGLLIQVDSGGQLLAAAAIVKGALALGIMRLTYAPAVSFFELPSKYAFTLPFCGVLYGLMTLDSAVRHASGKRSGVARSKGACVIRTSVLREDR